VAQKIWRNILYAWTLPNINRFSKLFYCQNQQKICNSTITKDLTTPQLLVVCPTKAPRRSVLPSRQRPASLWKLGFSCVILLSVKRWSEIIMTLAVLMTATAIHAVCCDCRLGNERVICCLPSTPPCHLSQCWVELHLVCLPLRRFEVWYVLYILQLHTTNTAAAAADVTPLLLLLWIPLWFF